jgi:hypothetical protein
MRTFHIYHAVNPTFTSEFNQERELVGTVSAESLEDAYVRSQNIGGHWNPINHCRSTSIGDVIQDTKDGVQYVVFEIGFIELPAND